MEREKAEEKYEDTVAQGHSAFKLSYDLDKDDVVVMDIGTLPSGKIIEVRMTVV